MKTNLVHISFLIEHLFSIRPAMLPRGPNWDSDHSYGALMVKILFSNYQSSLKEVFSFVIPSFGFILHGQGGTPALLNAQVSRNHAT